MSRIRILPDQVINQIAAGEVVERPASVVKELIENSIDAGSCVIAVDVESGGRRRIRVTDDGEGLDRDDALMALERHATSKLSDGADLARIATLGFRGEALPSIAAVSRLTLESSREGGAGTRVEIEAGRVRRVSDVAHPKGTTIDVRDLFFNTPARAKFLKSTATELGHISELVAASSVAVPRIRVTLAHEGRLLLDAPSARDERDRLRRAYGPEWEGAIPFEATRGALSLRGFLLPPSGAATTRRQQHVYVNGRVIKDRLVGHAILTACEEFLPKDRHAALFLFIDCPADAVDVNVHPAKAEVRFADPRAVHDLVHGAVARSLSDAMPVTALGLTGVRAELASGHEGFSARGGPAVHDATVRYLAQQAGAVERPDIWRPHGDSVRAGEAMPLSELDEGPVPLAHYRESYILAADREGLLIIDQHAAHERILYDEMIGRAGVDAASGARQALLLPVTVELPRELIPRCEEAMQELGHLGFSVERFGETTLIARDAPALVPPGDLVRLLHDLLDQICAGQEEGEGPGRLLKREKLVATVACHAAIKVRMPLTTDKMNYLIRALFRTSAPLKCPHGRPAVLRFPHATLEREFDRR